MAISPRYMVRPHLGQGLATQGKVRQELLVNVFGFDEPLSLLARGGVDRAVAWAPALPDGTRRLVTD